MKPLTLGGSICHCLSDKNHRTPTLSAIDCYTMYSDIACAVFCLKDANEEYCLFNQKIS